MLKGVSKLLTGDMLKILCDMGHGDEIVLADANFPGDTIAKRLIRVPGIDATTILKAVAALFPLDEYTDAPAIVMEITDSDKAKGMEIPAIFGEFNAILKEEYGDRAEVKPIERYEFYDRAKKAYAVIQTGEERIYGNLLLVKGVIK